MTVSVTNARRSTGLRTLGGGLEAAIGGGQRRVGQAGGQGISRLVMRGPAMPWTQARSSGHGVVASSGGSWTRTRTRPRATSARTSAASGVPSTPTRTWAQRP